MDQIHKGFFYNIGKILENKIYKSAKGFIFPVPSFKDYLNGFPGDISTKPMFSLMNGVSKDFIGLSKKSKYITENKFTVLYSGNMGYAQDLNTIIKCAENLKEYDIFFRFIGEGVCKSELMNLSRHLGKKIQFHKPMKRDSLVEWIMKASVCIVPLKKRKIFESAIPSKMFEYMACAKPVILGVKGEASRILEKSKSGTSIEPESVSSLTSAILNYHSSRDKCKRDGQNGLKYVEENLSKEILLKTLMSKIENDK